MRLVRLVLRYLLYLAFVAAAVLFWLLFFLYITAPADPGSCLSGRDCGEASFARNLVAVASVWLAMPLTALVFVFYRRLVRWLLANDA